MDTMQMLMQMLTNGGDANGLIQMLASQNPMAQAMLNQQKQSGKSMKDFVMQYAKQNNINIQPLIDMAGRKM